jgi:hypothetical protein
MPLILPDCYLKTKVFRLMALGCLLVELVSAVRLLAYAEFLQASFLRLQLLLQALLGFFTMYSLRPGFYLGLCRPVGEAVIIITLYCGFCGKDIKTSKPEIRGIITSRIQIWPLMASSAICREFIPRLETAVNVS